MSSIGLKYENFKNYLGGGVTIVPATFGNGLNNSYDNEVGAYAGGSLEEFSFSAKKEEETGKSFPWGWIIITIVILIAAVLAIRHYNK